MLRLLQWRRFWQQVHLWLGLLLALPVIVVCVSGSLLVFREELDSWLNPALLAPPLQGGRIQPAAALLSAGLAATIPAGAAQIRLRAPQRGQTAWSVFVQRRDGNGRIWMEQIGVHPETAQPTGRRDYTASPLILLYHLHEVLLLRLWWGAELVGGIGLVLLVSSLSGLYLWWPRPGRWKAAFWIKRAASPRRFLLDLHNVLGLYSLAIVLILSFSGVYLSFPNPVRGLVRLVAADSPFPALPARSAPAGATRLDLTTIFEHAQAAFPGASLDNARKLDGPHGLWRFAMRLPEESGHSPANSMVWLDPYSGAVLARRDARALPAGERFLILQRPLHNGEALGLAGRWLACIGGLVPAGLAITGWMLWLRRQRGRISRAKPQAAQR